MPTDELMSDIERKLGGQQMTTDFQVKAYLAMPYRGPLGDMATKEDIAGNIEKAIQIGQAIKARFPRHLEIYIPHIDSELQTDIRDESGRITNSDSILDRCICKLADCDILIHCGDISSGMALEIDFAQKVMPVVAFPMDYSDGDFEPIAVAMWQVWRKVEA
jgi:hypothetical protein